MSDRTTVSEREASPGLDPALFLALLLSLVAALPLLIGPGIVNTRAGGDSPFLLQRVQQLSESLRTGLFPAHWMPDGAYGLGYPFFSFYAALPYYLAAVLNLAGVGVLWGIKLTQVLGFLLAGGAMYALARGMRAGRAGALLASAAYTFAPFHLVNVYVRGDSLSEFYALAFYPLILWALLRLRARPSTATVAGLAGCYALLVLTHNISALLFSPLLGLWLLVEALSARGQRGRVLFAGLGALALGLLLSAWFWLPALREQSLVQLQEQTTGYFHYSGHFRALDLVQRGLAHDYTIDAQRNPFNMGLMQAVLAVLGLLALGTRLVLRHRVEPSHLLAVLVLLVYTWLITPVSAWVWAHVPLLPMVQFPWRLLSVQALAVALLASHLPTLWARRWVGGALSFLLAALVAWAGLAGLQHPDRLPLNERDINPQTLMLYELYSGNIGTTVRYEYLPREMVPRPYTSGVQLNGGQKPPPLALEGVLRAAQLRKRTPEAEQWTLDAATPVLLAFHTTYYPGWEAIVDGTPQPVTTQNGLGLVALRLPEGQHQVALRFRATPLRRYTTWVSLAGLALWLGLAGYAARWTFRGGATPLGAWACAALALLVIPLPSQTLPEIEGPRVMDFARAPYLHPEPEGIFFGDAHLQAYTLAPSYADAGDTLSLTLRWERALPDYTVRVQCVAATAHLLEPAPVWAEANASLDQAELTLRVTLPPELPSGLYVPRLSVFRGRQAQTPRTSQGVEMGLLALEPVQVAASRTTSGQESALGAFGPEQVPPVIALVGAEATQREGLLEVALTWRCERQAPLNYTLSLRLYRAEGDPLVSRDLPPLLGNYPTSLWQPGELITDRVCLPLQEPLPPGVYRLEVVLYDRMTLQAAGTATLERFHVE